MWIRVSDRRVFSLVLAALIAVCWAALAIWSFSPYAPFLSHEVLEGVHFAIGLEYLSLLLVFLVGWMLMITAMMLPTSLPLILLFRRLVRSRHNESRLVALLITGYLSVWVLFGLLSHLGDLVFHSMVHHVTWLGANTWAISASIFAVAGLYQFSSLKYRCLDKCRSPLSFIVGHWQGRYEQRRALQLGVHHGLFCLGCCWSLMLLMFAVGSGSIPWMLLLGAIMAVEKNMSWGRHISQPLGAALIVAGLLQVVVGVQRW